MYEYDEQEQDIKITHYLVPTNVSTRFEIFEGFGWTEAKYVAIALICGLALYLLTGLFTRTEQFNIKDIPQAETIGLKENKNTKIEGNIVTRKKEVIPKAVRFFFILVPGIGAYIVTKRDPSTGMSLVTNLQAAREFAKKQKRYLFKYNSGSEV